MTGMLRHVSRAVLTVLLVSAPVDHAQTPTAGIDGTVSDDTGGVLPGVTVTAVSTGEPHKVTTDSRGRYWLDELPPGAYRVTAELSGFKSSVAVVVVKAGRLVDCDFMMSVAANSIVTDMPPGGQLLEALRKADVVVHLRVMRVVGPRLSEQSLLTTEHVAAALSLLKGVGRDLVPNGVFHFLQMQAGEWSDNGRTLVGENKPYGAGDELIGLFEQNVDELQEYAGGAFMFRIVDGKVEWPARLRRDFPPGIQDGLPVTAFETAIFKIITAGR